MAKTPSKDTTPGPLQVKESFTTIFKGATVDYREGEAVHPDDPIAKARPELFEPLQYRHDPAVIAVGAPEPEPDPEPEPEPEPDPLSRQGRAGGQGTPAEEPQEA